MSIKATHPEYDNAVEDWTLVRDCYEGETEVKRKRTLYLPPTDSMTRDGMDSAQSLGYQRYEAYLRRARFSDHVSVAVERMVSMINRQAPQIELPQSLEYLKERATPNGETLEEVYRTIIFEQILCGRFGLLPDFEGETNNPEPVLALYHAESIRNWMHVKNVGISMVVLDESDYEMEDFEWEYEESYRVLMLTPEEDGQTPVYRVGVFTEDEFSVEGLITPQIRGNTLEEVPFTFINAGDLTHEVGKIPMIGLARLCIGMYQSEADYRSNLFMQGQDTLVVKDLLSDEDGADVQVGPGSYLNVGPEGDAFYIGVSGKGLPEQRQALENDKKEAEEKSLSLALMSDNQSGEALKTRIAAQSLSLVRIAQTGAAGLEMAIRHIARWMGLNEEDVSIQPNIDFRVVDFLPGDLNKLMIARGQGAPLSLRSIHEMLVEKGYSNRTYEEELELIEEETMNALGSDDVNADEDVVNEATDDDS